MPCPIANIVKAFLSMSNSPLAPECVYTKTDKGRNGRDWNFILRNFHFHWKLGIYFANQYLVSSLGMDAMQ